MHPPLFKDHPLCKTEVKMLVACHAEFPVGKFMGMCNEPKSALDECFRMEKRMRRSMNSTKHRVSARSMLKDIESREAALAKK